MSDSNTPSQKVIDIQENLPKLISTTPTPSVHAYSSIKAAKTNPNTIPLLSRSGHSYCYIPDDFASYSCKKNEVIILISAHGENLSCYTRDLATNEILLSSFDTFNSPRNIRNTRIIRLPGIGVMSETISNTVLPIIVESITKNKCSEHNFNNIFQQNKKETETRFNSQMSASDFDIFDTIKKYFNILKILKYLYKIIIIKCLYYTFVYFVQTFGYFFEIVQTFVYLFQVVVVFFDIVIFANIININREILNYIHIDDS